LKKSYAGFVSPEEMAKLVNIDVQRRKPRELYKGIHAYDDVSANGNTFDVSIDKEGRRFVNLRISNFRIGGEVTEGFKPRQVVDLPSMISKSRQEITKMVGISPYKDDFEFGQIRLRRGPSRSGAARCAAQGGIES
jgi:hypothetical protein